MLEVTFACVGSLKERFWREAVQEYQKRLQRYCRFQCVEIDEVRLPQNPSQKEIDAALDAEGEALLHKLPRGCQLIALCVEGKEMDSVALSEMIEDAKITRGSSIAFVIGSSYGLSQQVKQAAKLRLSVSQMTFPHQLMRVMLCEQIYRAFKIAAGEKYHK